MTSEDYEAGRREAALKSLQYELTEHKKEVAKRDERHDKEIADLRSISRGQERVLWIMMIGIIVSGFKLEIGTILGLLK